MGRKKAGKSGRRKAGRHRSAGRSKAGNSGEHSGIEAGTESGKSGTETATDPETMVGATDMTVEQSPEGAAPAELLAEADAALAGAAPEALTADGQPPPPIVDATAEFRMVLTGPISLATVFVLPQWEITDDERTELTESMSMCFAQLFPDGINGKYACWFRLVACSGIIVATRFAKGGGKLPGIGPKKAERIAAPEHGPASPA